MISLAESYAHCRKVAKERAKNFYYSFVLLDENRRNAMCAMYAFMRYCDDLSDEPGANRAAIEGWRSDMESALAGKPADNAIWPAFLDTIARYNIPHGYFRDMIDGVASDLEPRTIHNFEELYAYCYRVASVVGLVTVHIFGFCSPEALPLAEKCGIAFQLTNILRDIKEDAGLGRVYLPEDELVRFRLSAADLKSGRRSDRFAAFMDFQIDRAADYYNQSRPLLEMVDPEAKNSLWALIAIYRGLLERIAETPTDVLTRRMSLPVSAKLWIVLRALAGLL
jgi:phytoene synthase